MGKKHELGDFPKVGAGTKAVVGGLALVILLVKLAFLALVAWGIYELVVWVTSK